MPSRARDWFNQAVRDLEQAKDSQKAGRHEWACFAAQQVDILVYTLEEWQLNQTKKFFQTLENEAVWVYRRT